MTKYHGNALNNQKVSNLADELFGRRAAVAYDNAPDEEIPRWSCAFEALALAEMLDTEMELATPG